MKKSERYIADRLPADFFERVRKGEFNRDFFPRFSNRKMWNKFRKSDFAGMIIQEADLIPENQVPQLLFSVYQQFPKNGNRTNYEGLYFKRRKDLGFLAAALCLTGDTEKYMNRVIDYTAAILEERSWCVPAHARWQEEESFGLHFCDLFSAETGAQMALLVNILGEKLEEEVPGIIRAIREKTLSQTVYTALDKTFPHWWNLSERPANWTPWCSSNNIITSLLLETNGQKRAAQIRRFLENCSRFIYYYADDGYCPEGPSYYMKANLMIFQTLFFLEKAFPGSMKPLFAEPKLKAMAEFLPNARIGEDNIVTFGDAQPGLRPCQALLIPAGQHFKSEMLLELSGLKESVPGTCGDYLCSLLELLCDRPAKLPQKMTAGAPVTEFKNRLAIFRSDKLSVSLKSGHNSEPHNHNDQGHFELFSGNVPVILDAGTGAYAKINFTELRYTLWNTRGSGHNAPVFGKYEQVKGAEYYSSFELDKQTLCCDLSNAYPEEAGVKTAERKISFNKTKVVVEDSFSLKKNLPVTITLLTVCEPVIKDDNTIRLGDVTLSLENISFAETERMPDLAHVRNGKMVCIWGAPVTAIRLKTKKNGYKMTFSLKKQRNVQKKS